MASFSCFSAPSLHPCTALQKSQFLKPMFLNYKIPISSPSSFHEDFSKSKLFVSISSSSTVSTEQTGPPKPDLEAESKEDKFDWYSQWYPVMPVCDLDKRVPHAKKVLGLDVVVWWDRNEDAWKVFDDMCPHRLAPLSEGRIDQWGRLQCVYHGWCFNGSGDCKFIPQAPIDGPPVHNFNKACAIVYPTVVHHDIVWFWPNSDPQYKDVILKKKPPYIPELDDPSFTRSMGNRDIPYGVKLDREGGRPVELTVKKLDINGFIGKLEWGSSKFISPCIFYLYTDPIVDEGNGSASSAGNNKVALQRQRRAAIIFFGIPVSPGNSRLIWAFPRNFGVWIDKFVPRWMFHVGQNLILDSDMYLLHIEERKIMDFGPTNWQKACYVPTKSDNFVVNFRRWFNKYAGGAIDWKGKYSFALPPTPPRDQLMDRYRSHVVNCSSCRSAYKILNALEFILHVLSLVSIGVIAAIQQNVLSTAARTGLVSLAVLCFAASRFLAYFVYKNFHYHDYNHALR